MKIFVFAVQCAGKTTLAKFLRATTKHNVVEMDDEIMRLNGGSWPRDFEYKITKLEPIVYDAMKTTRNVIFTDSHLVLKWALELKQSGFSIVLIEVEREELFRRNKDRFESGTQSDASRWIDIELDNVEQLRKAELIDKTIDGHNSIEEIAEELLAYAHASRASQ